MRILRCLKQTRLSFDARLRRFSTIATWPSSMSSLLTAYTALRGVELRGDAYRQFLTSVVAAFPDGRWTIEDQVAEGDKVATRWTFIGTHQGEIMGFAPTGRQVRLSGMMMDHIVGGKIAEEWEEYDNIGMVQQLGAATLSSKVQDKPAV